MLHFPITDERRRRLSSGGELSPSERLMVETIVIRYFMWIQKERSLFDLRWEGDDLHVTGEPYDGWNGITIFPAERCRQFVLHFFGDPNIPEPDAALPWIPTKDDEDWMLQDTWVVGRQPENATP